MTSLWGVLKKREIDGIPGLVTVVAQDSKTGEVLMVAYTDEDGFNNTLETGKAHYYSTSRRKSWLKGESSGHTQKVEEVLLDCDMDCIVLKIIQEGGACHKGYRSCFFRKVAGGEIVDVGEKIFSPDEVY